MKQLEKWVKEGSVDTVVVAGIDLQGRLYGKRCAAIPFLRDLAGGVHTCDCNFGWDIERMLISGLKFTGWHTGYGDMTLVPDWTTLRKIPWFEKTALVVCDTYDHHGHLVDIAPRTMLRKQIEKAKKLSFDVKAAPELEFFLFRETLESSRAKDYRDLEPMSRYISDYSIFRSSMDEWVIGPMRRNLAEAGIEVECNKAEWGHGQMEINLVYGDVLPIADKHVIFKTAIREMAALNGVQATFMAKWDSKHSGNGAHIHMSLWKQGKNAFPDAKGEHGMSAIMRHFLGGMMNCAKDLQLFYMPNVNSYKRIEDLSFAPSNITWGGDNRTSSFRVAGQGKSMRLENRIPGADANAHLIYAAMLASGLHGIEHKLEPVGPFVAANAYELPNPPKLHRTLTDATDAFEKSKTARQLLGDNVVDHYTQIARWEQNEYNKYVTDWERRRYFELI
ncbi:MAG: glutamine synthetase [Candidatus Hydrogenedentes bacterium]|nr:glutamine synthetase [Candidatus Hydrogenedentota bacterium]